MGVITPGVAIPAQVTTLANPTAGTDWSTTTTTAALVLTLTATG